MTAETLQKVAKKAALPPDLVAEAAAFVYQTFKEKLPKDVVFHTYQHTVDVANAAAKIGRKADLPADEQQRVQLAAWLHDLGYIETYEGHEEASVRLGEAFMRRQGVDEEEIRAVSALILATRLGHEPRTLAEQVIRDADMAHVGQKNFFEYAERLRMEWQARRGTAYTDQEWAEVQHDFLADVTFYTPWAQKKYGKRRDKHLKAVRGMLAGYLNEGRAVPVPKLDKKVPSRGIETMFRTSYRNHIQLSEIADSKANIIISINAILMSIIISYVSGRLQTDPWLTIPAATLLVSSLIATVFAILATRPKVTSKTFTIEDVRRSRANILFFGNFVNLKRVDFQEGIRELMEDYDMLYDNMINDLYGLGLVLEKKYRLLWYAYTIFMAGLTISVVLFLLLFFTI